MIKTVARGRGSTYGDNGGNGDNSDKAVLTRAVLNHESVKNTIPSKLDFRRLCYSIGVEKGFSRAAINACVASYEG